MPFDGTKQLPNTKAIELLRATEDLLSNPRRWTKDVYLCKGFLGIHKSYCLIGAAWTAATKKELPLPILREALDTLERAIEPTRLVSIQRFNDDPATTHKDVLRVLREAQVLR